MKYFSKINEYINFLLTKKQNILFPLGIFLAAIIWRLYKIGQIPVALNQDELAYANYFISVVKNGWKIDPQYIYFGFYTYLMSGFGYLVGFKVEFLRAFQAFLGASSVLVFYFFVKSWFNRQAALLASLFLATSSFHLLISRNLDPRLFTPLILIVILYAFTSALRTNKKIYFVLSGFALGFSYYIDLIYIFTPIAIILGCTYLYFKNKKIFSAYWKGFLITFITFLLTILPFIFLSFSYLRDYLIRFVPGSIGAFYLNLGSNIQSLFYQAPLNVIYNVGTEPILDPFVTVSFICGLIYAWFYLRRKKFLFMITWFVLGLFILSLLKIQNLINLTLLLPVIFTLSAIMLDYVLTHWVRTFPFNKAARLLMSIVFSLFLFLSILYNYQKYFWAFGHNNVIQSNYQNEIQYKK